MEIPHDLTTLFVSHPDNPSEHHIKSSKCYQVIRYCIYIQYLSAYTNVYPFTSERINVYPGRAQVTCPHTNYAQVPIHDP